MHAQELVLSSGEIVSPSDTFEFLAPDGEKDSRARRSRPLPWRDSA
jgi:hypothetical protein